MTSRGRQVLYSPHDGDLQISYGDGNAHIIAWIETRSLTLDTPDWVLRAYDRRTHQQWIVARAPAGTRGTEPQPVVEGNHLLWSSDSPDNRTLAVWTAVLRPGAHPILVRRNAAQPHAADGGLYYVVRRGPSNRLVFRNAAGHERATTIKDVRVYAATNDGIAWVSKGDGSVLHWSPRPPSQRHTNGSIPLDSAFYGLSAGHQVVAYNTETSGGIYQAITGAERRLSHDDAQNNVQARGCWVFWTSRHGKQAFVARACSQAADWTNEQRETLPPGSGNGVR